MSSSATPWRRADSWISTRDKCNTRTQDDRLCRQLDPWPDRRAPADAGPLACRAGRYGHEAQRSHCSTAQLPLSTVVTVSSASAAGLLELGGRGCRHPHGVAKGVLHRHFADFDAFLAELVLEGGAALRAAPTPTAGTATIPDNLAEILTGCFTPLAVSEMALVVTRDGLRRRLAATGAVRFPLLSATHAKLSTYLAEEQAQARVAATTDIATLAHLLVGSAHLVATDRENGPPDRAAMHRLTTAVLQAAG